MKQKQSNTKMAYIGSKIRVGITALVPPEVIFSCNCSPVDVNNFVPYVPPEFFPSLKLCAWTALWRELIGRKKIRLDALVAVTGGDCHNALVDAQKAAMAAKGMPAHYFFYPFDGDRNYLEEQLNALAEFLAALHDEKFRMRWKIMKKVAVLKELGSKIERMRSEGKGMCGGSGSVLFRTLLSFSDMEGSLEKFGKKLMKFPDSTIRCEKVHESLPRIAMLGVPPIYIDFHDVAESSGLRIVFDELPYEFIRHTGTDIKELSASYASYTFARPLEFRINFLKNELKKRKVDGVIHYTQYACHHVLEDDVLRKELPYPMLTVQGDTPGKCSEQLKLRLEAFAEMLGRK